MLYDAIWCILCCGMHYHTMKYYYTLELNKKQNEKLLHQNAYIPNVACDIAKCFTSLDIARTFLADTVLMYSRVNVIISTFQKAETTIMESDCKPE